MNRTIAWTAIIGLATVLTSISVCRPELLSDGGNAFLKNFVNQELLSLLGVIVTITLASAASLHLELNKLQEVTKERFVGARRAVKLSAYSLIGLFAVAFVLVVSKPLLAHGPSTSAAFNSVAIVIFAFNIMVLLDLTRTIFRIPALAEDDGDDSR